MPYRWSVAPGEDGRPRLVEVSGKNGIFSGFPQLWDVGPVAVLEADDVLVLAPEMARSEAEVLLPGLSKAAGRVREDFPTFGDERETVTVQLAPSAVLADAIGEDEGAYPIGGAEMQRSTDDPGLRKLRLEPDPDISDTRIMLDIDIAVEDHEVWGDPAAGNTMVRHLGAYAAVAGPELDRSPVARLTLAVPVRYELSDHPSLEPDLLWLASEAHLAGPPEELPETLWLPSLDEDEVVVQGVSLLRHLEETHGRAAVLGFVDLLARQDAWYDRDVVDDALAEAVGTTPEETLAGWQAWGEGLLTRVDDLGPAFQEG